MTLQCVSNQVLSIIQENYKYVHETLLSLNFELRRSYQSDIISKITAIFQICLLQLGNEHRT